MTDAVNIYPPITKKGLGRAIMGDTQRVSLGEVDVAVFTDGDWVYMNTINGICIKSYQGHGRWGQLVGDINRLRSGEGIDL